MTAPHAKKQPSAISIEGEDTANVRRTGNEKESLPEEGGKTPNATKLLWPFKKFSEYVKATGGKLTEQMVDFIKKQ